MKNKFQQAVFIALKAAASAVAAWALAELAKGTLFSFDSHDIVQPSVPPTSDVE